MCSVWVAFVDKLLSKEKKKKEEPSSLFQRQRVDELLAELSKKFPPKYASTATSQILPQKQGTCLLDYRPTTLLKRFNILLTIPW